MWLKAKTSAKIGPYTTHSSIPKEWEEVYRSWLESLPPTSPLLSPGMKDRAMRELQFYLKKQHPGHDLRSLRRGALCAMARDGVPMETLLVFSGHKTIDMLLRYLRRGRASFDRAKKGAEAAKAALH